MRPTKIKTYHHLVNDICKHHLLFPLEQSQSWRFPKPKINSQRNSFSETGRLFELLVNSTTTPFHIHCQKHLAKALYEKSFNDVFKPKRSKFSKAKRHLCNFTFSLVLAGAFPYHTAGDHFQSSNC